MTYNFTEEYDIIVIGAGHAGALVRVQLSVPFVRRLTRNFTLRRCARQLKIKTTSPFVRL